jgi:exodeoxyribonuclease-5
MQIYQDRVSREVLLTGDSGTGKTTLMQKVAKSIQDIGHNVVCVGPTHQSVKVLSRKMVEAELDVPCMTEHSLMGLRPAAGDTEKTVLKKIGKSRAGAYQAVVVDETSMNGHEMQRVIDNDLAWHFRLYVGDPAQLPPVGEARAPIFDRMIGGEYHAHLSEVVRQAADNPILQAAGILRRQQGGALDMSWVRTVEHGQSGVYCAGTDGDKWLNDAFTSEVFREDNDSFRYLAYTNNKVKEINAKARYWIYGETETPFVPGERVMCRNPVLDGMGRPAFQTNEEAYISDIELSTKKIYFEKRVGSPGQLEIPEWYYDLPVWKVSLVRNQPDIYRDKWTGEQIINNDDVTAYIPVNEQELQFVIGRIRAEAQGNKARWKDLFLFKDEIADLRPVYSMTIHTSQGSTFSNVLIDVPDCNKLISYKLLEYQQLMYVALTRARFAACLMGV